MNKMEIADLFIKASFIDSRLPINTGPKKLKCAWVGNSALTEEDMRKWFVKEPTDEGKDKIIKGDKGPVHDWWMAFWDGRSVDTSRNDYRLWELANALIVIVADEGNRRALWAWSMSKVGALQAHETKTRTIIKKLRRPDDETLKVHKRTSRDVSFAAWCHAEGIHEMTGSRRKNRAIAVIEQYLVRGASSNVETGHFGVLPVGHVFEHISDIITADAPNRKERFFQRDADTVFCKDATIFNWREIRNADRRRKFEARKQKAA